MKKRIPLFLFAAICCLSLCGCISQEDLDAAYQEGYDTGSESAYSAGFADGTAAVVDDPESYGIEPEYIYLDQDESYQDGYQQGYEDGYAAGQATDAWENPYENQ